MSLLAELFEQLDTAPENCGQRQTFAPVGAVEVDASAPATNDHQTAHDAPCITAAPAPIPTPAPAAEASAEPKRNAWTITRGGKSVCTICGAPMTYSEALAEARWRWPDAAILES